ncbi:MAG: hypothetical protein HY600_05655 [Candidatus Omnitrophica bacterium]|nr:hypothetical protein [Candidatus Omnitrophota bacterium]
MPSPADWMGAINRAFARLPAREAAALRRRFSPVARAQQMVMYTDRGAERVIDAQYRPWLVTDHQRRFFHRACLTLKSALARILPLYLADPRVRQVVPLEPEEEAWCWQVLGGAPQTPQTVFDRLDSTATFAHPRWAEDFWFLEPNSVGIGGVHYIPATYRTVQALTAPWLRRAVPSLRVGPMDDTRDLLLAALRAHARAIGRRRLHVAFLEDQSERSGTAEFEHIADYFRRRGVRAVATDPRQLALRRGEISAGGFPVDVFYRDTEVTEFLALERAGVPMGAVREAFRRNQVVSSIAGEFDHKSAWELFTNPIFRRHFTPAQRGLFARHVLWTRLLWERTTTDPQGRPMDLAAYARRHRATLVLKPNREYGGLGVTFGRATTQARWERALEAALRRPGTTVVQQAAPVHIERFPQIAPDGRVTLEPRYVVTGFAATPRGLGILGRSSSRAVVNVSRGGGLIAVARLRRQT